MKDERILMGFRTLDGIHKNAVPAEHDTPGLAQPCAAELLGGGGTTHHPGVHIVAGTDFSILVVFVFPCPVIEIEQDGLVVEPEGIEDGERAAGAGG